MNSIDNKILEQITEFAKLPNFTNKEIARVVGIPSKEFLLALKDEEHPYTIAYDKGKLLLKAEFAKKIMQLSNQGSGPAQTLLLKMRRDNEYYNLLEQYGG